ncbi:MAG: hypothetical protein GX957_10500, partial [Clostridiaceae bacterium]|nr:hypothetical protein [Clostridiaceae bacterium]
NCTVFSNLNFDNKRPQEADWDLSQISNGTVKCLNPAHRVILDLDNTYKSSRYVEANIQLPRVEKQDTRAGFRFTNKSGQDAFVALTMTNEKGEYTYTLQIIHRAGNSWAGKFNRKFDIFNLTADEVKEAASSKDGIPFAVWYHDGLFDVWVNNTLVMADSYPSDGDVNIFSDDNKVTFGLESWRYKTQFTGLKYGETDKRPQSADWKKISDTEYQSKSLSNKAELILDSTRRNKVFVTANVQLPMVSYDDSRGGFEFYKEDGTGVFLGLQTNKSTQKYSVLAITLKPDGSTDWGTDGSFIDISDDEDIYKAANSSQGVPIGVLYDKGKFDLWINGKLVGYNINARGDSAFTENSKVTVSLESWRNYTSYHKVAISDSVSSYKLNGTVKLYQNGTYVPLANTEITFVGAHDGYTFKLTTDSQGRFASPNPVPMDMYTLSYGDSSYTGPILHSSDNAKECVIQFNYAYVVEGSADLSRMNDDNHTIIVNESSMVRLNTGSAFASQRYYVLSLKIRALSPITYDWNKNTGVAFASVGAGKGNTYMMSFLIGTSEDENMIKIQNNDKGHGSFNGENIPQNQWYKNAIMTQQLFGDGINCKYVRANKYVYLLAELDGKWQQIGRMLIGDRDNDILFLNWYTKTEYSHITLTEGISAVADALSGY